MTTVPAALAYVRLSIRKAYQHQAAGRPARASACLHRARLMLRIATMIHELENAA